ncbi:MAG: DUF2189 domain-containing protein, partial [Alphaproteobacteria bacterium]|nr:DUF2189 domain-containing protein [Alphaproteobacteria bacterium]
MSTLEHQEISTPSVRRIGMIELREALRRGYEDFAELRSDVIFLTLVYPVAMLVIILAFSGAELVPLIFPFVAGGALLGPFLASGLYELSRRREEGRDTRWRHAFDVFKSPSFGSMATLAALLLLL